MKKILLFITALYSFCGLSAQGHKELTIIHLNDTHSHFEPERKGNLQGRGGIVERSVFIDSVRRADGKHNVLLLHAGDFSQGTSYFPTFHGDLEIKGINALKYDVVTLGNHEFDNGIEELARRLKSLRCPVVCANYDFAGTPLFKMVKPYTIIRKSGMKIGVIGLLTDLSSMTANETVKKLHKLNDAEVTNYWANYLKNVKHCDMVIALTHIGYQGEEYTDPQLVSQTRNIDLVVGGHSHTFLDSVKYAKNLDGNNVPIVQNGCWGLNVGLLKMQK